MTKREYLKKFDVLQKKYNAASQKLAAQYIKAHSPFKKNTVYEVTYTKTKRGKEIKTVERFVVFAQQIIRYTDIGFINLNAGVWLLDENNNCVTWKTLHSVDDAANKYIKSKNQTWIKPKEPQS